MSTQPDIERLVETFFDEGPRVLPVSSYEAVRTAVDQTRQRFVFGPWKEQQIMNAARLALGAAAVLLLAVIGIRFLPGVMSGPGATSTPEPTPTPQALVNGPTQSLPAGQYVINDQKATRLPFTFLLPGGWVSWESQDVSKGGTLENPFAERAAFGSWVVDSVYRDACHWTDNLAIGLQTRQAIIDALSIQVSRDATEPSETTLDGLPATRISLTVPSDFDATTCDEGFMRGWPGAGPNEQFGWATTPGETQDVYVVDTSNGPTIVFIAVKDTATATDRAEVEAILESVNFLDH